LTDRNFKITPLGKLIFCVPKVVRIRVFGRFLNEIIVAEVGGMILGLKGNGNNARHDWNTYASKEY